MHYMYTTYDRRSIHL